MLQPLRPGPLTLIHKATILIAVVGFVLYAVWEGRHFATTGDPGSALGAVVGVVGAAAAAVYLRSLVRTPSGHA